MEADRERRIRERAHALWEEGGRQDGHHDRDWERATAEIDGPDHAPGKAKRSAGKAAVTSEAPAGKSGNGKSSEGKSSEGKSGESKSGKAKAVPDDVTPKSKDKKKGKKEAGPAAETSGGKADKTKPTLDIPPTAAVKGRGRKSSAG